MKIIDLNIMNMLNATCVQIVTDDHEEATSIFGGIEKGIDYEMKITKKQKRRSLDANAYAWVLIKKLAKHYNIPPEQVYRKEIHELPCYDIVPIKADAVERWKSNWESKGLGWICEIMGDSKIQGYVNTVNFYGSSVYSSVEMARLIDNILDDCNDAGIHIEDKEDIERAKGEWRQ